MNRRVFLEWLVKGGSLVAAGVVGIPALINVLSPVLKARRPRWQPVGALDDFPVGEVTETVVEVPREDWSAALREKGVFVWRPAEDELVVFSRNCTDLSCPLTWDRGSQWFLCPCHGGIFSRDGERQAGPPKRPMYRYENRIRENVLEIDLNSLPPMT